MYRESMSTVQWNKTTVAIVGVVMVIVMFWFFSPGTKKENIVMTWPEEKEKEHNQEYSVWPPFRIDTTHDEVLY